MKSKYIFFFILFQYCSFINAQIINIPNANFKNRLLGGYGYAKTYSYNVGPTNEVATVDTNQDGEIQLSEALDIEYINIANASLTDVTGIEYFTNLKGLFLDLNQITAINLAPLTKLKKLTLNYNQLTSLNLTGLIELIHLQCINNQIANFNFYGLSNLKIVYCANNLLSSLDFMDNPLFEDLGCKNNPNLTTIKIKNNHTQLFGSQTFLNQCWGGNSNLNYICADAVEIPALQSFLAGCNITQAITIDSNCVLGVEGFAKSELSVSPNPVQNVLSVSNENTVQYELYSILGAKMASGTLAPHGQLDCSSLAKGMYLLKLKGDGGESKVVKVVKE